MNGFAKTVLSFLLSWIRALIQNLWSLISSEDGGNLYRFLADHWLALVIALCIGGMLVDLVVYFFRWRPYYVWRSRLRRMRDEDEPDTTEEAVPSEPLWQEPAPQPEPAIHQPVYSPVQPEAYAPAAQATRIYQPVQEPELDEGAVLWDAEEPLDLEWQADDLPAYGSARPEPATYYHDIQAGFAPPVPPEQLYRPSASYQPPVPESAPVHPGLDEEAVRQSFALQTEEYPPEQTPLVVHAPAFRPFTVASEENAPLKPVGALSRLAKAARDLVGVEDEDHQPTFRDLQSTVDVSQAFHAPVYPQPMKHEEG